MDYESNYFLIVPRTASTTARSVGKVSPFFDATFRPSTQTVNSPGVPIARSASNPSSFLRAAAARTAWGL
jgi:hypothetical protein